MERERRRSTSTEKEIIGTRAQKLVMIIPCPFIHNAIVIVVQVQAIHSLMLVFGIIAGFRSIPVTDIEG